MEEAHREARAIVERGLSPQLTAFVRERWDEQFGLIQVG
jgi:hypothetical protein